MKKLLYIILMALTYYFTISTYAANTIRFGIIDFYPPFAFSSKSGNIYGFDVDIAKSVCLQLNATCSFTPMPLNELFTSLNQGKVDAIIGAISITPQRAAQFQFTQPYFKSTMSFVALAANNIDSNNLQGKKVGVEKGSTFYQYIVHYYGQKLTVIAFNTNQAMVNALAERKVDIILFDTPAASYWVKYSTGLFKLLGTPVTLSFDRGYGIAVKKGDDVLGNSVNNALTAIIKDGTLQKLKSNYGL